MLKTDAVWVRGEQTTLDRAAEMLRTPHDGPIHVIWRRAYYGGNTGTPFGMVKENVPCKLLAVTPRRLKLTMVHGGGVYYAAAASCRFATRAKEEVVKEEAK